MASATEASAVAAEALDVARDITAKIGNSPDPAQGVPGRGLFGVVSGLVGDIHLVGSKVDTLTESLATAAAAAEKAALTRRGSLGRVVGWIAGPAFAIAVAAFLGWLAGFHR